jgi:hypothetical protein
MGIIHRMAVEAPPRPSAPVVRGRPIAVPADAPNDVDTLLAIAASGDKGVNLGELSEEEFFRHFGLRN